MSQSLILDQHGHTAVITINNPPANTWTPDSLLELQQLIEMLNDDRNNYALVIVGQGRKFFSAGGDLTQLDHNDKGRAFEFINAFGSALETLADYQGVSIAAINGYAMGGGLEVALACDIRIAEPQAQMGLPECSVGLLPGGLGTQHLPWLVGEAWAKRMILLGERISADKALEIGLIQEIVDTGQALAQALVLAEKAAKQSPTSVRFCKELIMSARKKPLVSNFALERELFVKLWDTQDQKEGVRAFIEKRKPEWKNT
jgi:enoyl-CoA hydratase/carnithine racemase